MSKDNGADMEATNQETKLIQLSGDSVDSVIHAHSAGEMSQLLGQDNLSAIEEKAKLSQSFNRCAICSSSEKSIIRFDVEPGRPGAPICEPCAEQALGFFNAIAAHHERSDFKLAEVISAPSYIKVELDKYVVGQDKAKKTLSIALYNHYKRIKNTMTESAEGAAPKIDLKKSNLLMAGPSGTGKTLLAETSARTLNVPFVMTDATTMTPTGYIGSDVEVALTSLLMEADGDVSAAEMGIIYVDEVDKIASKSGGDGGRDIRGEEVQRALLKMLEGKQTLVPVSFEKSAPSIPMNTKNILFILSGAFVGLADIVRARLEKEQKTGSGKGMGFRSDAENDAAEKEKLSDDEALSCATPEDLQAYGFIPEFIGRIPVFVALKGHTEETLYKILTEPSDSIVKECQFQLAMENGPHLRFEDNALRAIAKKALPMKTGARALRSVIHEMLEDVMFEVPDMEGVTEVVVTAENVSKRTKPAYIRADNLTDDKMETMLPSSSAPVHSSPVPM